MTPTASSKKTLSSKVTFASLTQNNLGTVRKLNSVLFPIKYSEKFYSEILLPEVEDFCKLSASTLLFPISVPMESAVYYNDIPVGTICCRLETKGNVNHLYLLTMGVLAVRHGCDSTPRSDSGALYCSLALSFSWHRLVQLGCNFASCRCSYQTPNQPHISSCPDVKRCCEALLRTTWI
jgi:hypothetical protein